MSTAPEQEQPSPEESKITTEMAQDRPTIDAAVKSFLSLSCARSLTASATDAPNPMLLGIVKTGDVHTAPVSSTEEGSNQQQQALQVARAILQATNSFEFPIHKTVADELLAKPGLSEENKSELLKVSVVARLWNGLVQSKQKPSRFLGRKALKYAWKDMEVVSKLPPLATEGDEVANANYDRQVAWIEEFGRLLFHTHDPKATVDDDAALLWDTDGGQAELARRRERRQSAATERGPVTPS